MSRCTARRICPAKWITHLRSLRFCPVAQREICCCGKAQHMHRSQRLRREVCGDKGKRVGGTPPRASEGYAETCQPVCANSSKAIGTRLFWRAPAWSGSDFCHRGLNLKARGFLPKYCRQKIFFRLAVRASSLCKHAQPIGSRAKSCRRLMTWKRIFVYERSGSFCGYCRAIAICRWACTLDL